MKYAPQHHRRVAVSESDALRVRRYVVRMGTVLAAQRALGLGDTTMAAARCGGLMLATTRDRLLAALARVGA